jgi:hypothetical protein
MNPNPRPLLKPAPHEEAPLRPRQPLARRRRAALPLRVFAALRVSLLLGAPMLAASWLATSPVFALREIEVRGADRVAPTWITAQLADLEGRHLLAVSLREVRNRLEQHPWLADVAVRKQLPDHLTVEVTERSPELLLRRGQELVYVDRYGQVIAPWAPDPKLEALPLVIWSSTSPVPTDEVRALLAELTAARPDWAAAVSEIELLGDGDARVITAALPWALVVRRGSVAAGIGRLEFSLPASRALPPRPAAFDIRFERRIVVHPLTGSPSRGA